MVSFTVGGVTVYAYGLAVAGAAVLSFLFAHYMMKKAALKGATLSWFALLALPLGILCARAGYCLATLDWFLYTGVEFFFHFNEGGYILYGAMAGCLLAAWLTGKITQQPLGKIADALATPAALMIALCRLAEMLAGEGYGWTLQYWFDAEYGYSSFPLEDPSFLFRFPFGMQVWGEWKWAVCVFEAAAALVIMVCVLRMRARRAGGQALMMILMYAAMQALCESLRQDSVLRWGFVRISQVLSALVVAAVLLICCLKAPKPRSGRRIALTWAGIVTLMGIVMAMEFALEKKIAFLAFMDMDVCWLVMGLACIGMILLIRPLWKRAFE